MEYSITVLWPEKGPKDIPKLWVRRFRASAEVGRCLRQPHNSLIAPLQDQCSTFIGQLKGDMAINKYGDAVLIIISSVRQSKDASRPIDERPPVPFWALKFQAEIPADAVQMAHGGSRAK